jgi:hypothetical protein
MGKPPSLIACASPLLLGLAACNPAPEEEASRTPPEAKAEAAKPVAGEAAAPAPARLAKAPEPAPATAPARRCGWLSNPTPGNWWLTDRENQWVLASQGREPVEGMHEMPDMSTAGWVETNGHYGYGCACMTITYDPAAEAVTRIADAQPKPLKQCRSDRKLPKPE